MGSKGRVRETGRSARVNARRMLRGPCLGRRALFLLHLLDLRLAILIKMMSIVRILTVLALRALTTLLDVETELVWELHSPSPGFGLCLGLRLRLSLASTPSTCSLREFILLGVGLSTLPLSLDELLDGLGIMAEPTRATP